MYSYIIILFCLGYSGLPFLSVFLKLVCYVHVFPCMYIQASMELSWDLKILEMCPLLGTP